MDRMHVIVLIVQALGDGQAPGMVVNLQNILGATTWMSWDGSSDQWLGSVGYNPNMLHL